MKSKKNYGFSNINNYTIKDNQKLISNVEFLGGFVDKKEQMKILRDFSKKIYFKKKMMK